MDREGFGAFGVVLFAGHVTSLCLFFFHSFWCFVSE